MLRIHEIEDILDYKYKWSVNNGRIFQLNKNDDSICYNNLLGEIKFNEEKQLVLHLIKYINYSEFESIFDKHNLYITKTEAGKMCRLDEYFQLEFSDEIGRKWLSDKFLLLNGIQINQSYIKIIKPINNIKFLSVKRLGNRFHSYLSNVTKIESNRHSKDLNGKLFFNTYHLSLKNNDFYIKTYNNKSCSSLSLVSTESNTIAYKMYELFKEAINIINFSPLDFRIEDKYDIYHKKFITQINSYKKNISYPMILIPSNHANNINIDIFISKYIFKFIDSSSKFSQPLYVWWYRIYSNRLDIENKALILSVAIEALSLSHFPITKNLKAPYSYEEMATLGKLVKESNVSDDLKLKVTHQIGKANSSEKPVTLILKNLVKLGVLVKNMDSKWKCLRNDSAHGIERNLSFEDENTLEEMLNDTSLLEEIFFRLIFHIVGYTGMFYQLSQHGHPLTCLKAPELNKQD